MENEITQNENTEPEITQSYDTQQFLTHKKPSLFFWLASVMMTLAGALEVWIQLDAYNQVNAAYKIYLSAQASNVVISGAQIANPPSMIWVYGSLVFLLVGISWIVTNAYKQFRY